MKVHSNCVSFLLVQPCLFICGCGTGAPKVEAEFQHVLDVSCLAFSPDGRFLAAGSRDSSATGTGMSRLEGRLIVWEMSTGKEVANVFQPQPVQSLSFAPDSKLLAIGIGDYQSGRHEGMAKKPGEILVYDTDQFREVTKIEENYGVHAVQFSHDGKLLVSASFKGQEGLNPFPPGAVKVWMVGNWKATFDVSGLTDGRPSVSFHPTQEKLAVADIVPNADNPVVLKIFDVSTKKVTREFTVQKGGGVFVQTSAKGNRIATVSPDIVKLWEWDTGKDVTPAQLMKDFFLNAPVIALSPDGRLIASVQKFIPPSGKRKTHWVKIWDLEKQQLHAHWNWPTVGDELTSLTFSPDSNTLAVGSYKGSIKVFRVPD